MEGGERENTVETANRRHKQNVFHFSAPVDRRNKPAKTCLLNTSLSLLSGCSLNGCKSRATADGGGGVADGMGEGGWGMNALRLLSDTVSGCYRKAFMSVQPLSVFLNNDVAHSLH